MATKNTTETLHVQIRNEIEQRILSGEWPPGFRIPAEHEWMVRFGCSRMTVSKAIAELVTSGLVTRNRRAGSFVAQPRVHSAVLNIPDIRHDVEARGGHYGYRCLAMKRQADTISITSLHSSDGKPLLLEERQIFVDAVPSAAAVDFTQEQPGAWLLQHVPWTEAEHRILAESASAATAKALEIEKGAACLVVERRTWRGTETLTQVRQVFRGDAYDLMARFAP
jgi:GntR family transcriptional regulator, histidine utilization repressor